MVVKIGLTSMLMLIAGCHCAKLFHFGGTLGYDSHINGTIGAHTKIDRDGWLINGTSELPIGASWNSTFVGKGYAGVGDKTIGVDASLTNDINNFVRKTVQGEIGRNSNGTFQIGLQKGSKRDNKFLITPQFDLVTGDDARELVGLPQISGNQNENKEPVPKNEMGYNPAMNNVYPYGVNPYAANPYGVYHYTFNPNGANYNMANSYGTIPNNPAVPNGYIVNSYGQIPNNPAVPNGYMANSYRTIPNNPAVPNGYMANSYGTIPNNPAVPNGYMANSYRTIPNRPAVPNGYMANPYMSYVPYNSNGVPMNMYSYMGIPNNYMTVDQSHMAFRGRPFLERPNQQDQRNVKA